MENDVSWHVLRRILQQWAGSSAELDEVRSLGGGSIYNTLVLSARDGTTAVLKICSHRVNREVEREARQLDTLRKLGLPVPKVYGHHLATLDCPHSWLLIEHIDAMDLHEARDAISADEYRVVQEELADLCVQLHRSTAAQYHRAGDPDSPSFKSWPKFFHHVYDTIWQDVREAGILPARPRRQMERIHGKLDQLLAHDDRPRLVHGDFWSANVLVRRHHHGHWHVAALLDPNLKYAHAESELAYLELFQTITPHFIKRYHRHHQISRDYQLYRRDLYHAYDLLDHVHLFGSEYLKPLMTTLDKLDHVIQSDRFL